MILFSAISVATASDAVDNATISSIAEDQVIIDSTNTKEDVLADTPDTFTKLDSIIQGNSSGSTITLDRNYTYVSSDNNVNGITIDKDLKIDGAGYTLDGANMASIFKVTGGSHVILKNINFVNGQGSDGGALSWTANENVEVINSHFTNNSASNRGGAIYVASGDALTLNSAISTSTFTDNHAVSGGAIYVGGNIPSITSSEFSYNDATENGGAIFLDVGAYIQNCIFDHESAGQDGGAIFLNSTFSDVSAVPPSILEKLGVFDSTMTYCSAGRDGGAGYIDCAGGTVKNVTLMHNTAGRDGGAGYINCNNGKLIGSTIINNTAGRDGGGAMWIGLNGTIYDIHVTNNTATNGNGGGIYLYPGNESSALNGISIINCSSFNHNIASQYGGALYCGGLFSIIRNSTFTYDEAYNGAGIYLDVGAAISNCSFFKESATNDGGAIYLSASVNVGGISAAILSTFIDYIGVRNSTITNCSAGHDGGAGYVKCDYGVVKNVTMTNNYAGHDGGAGYVAGNYGFLTESKMINNVAENDGGALMWVGDGGNASELTCMLNFAGHDGGSVYVLGSDVEITESNFSLSNATFSGGALYVAGDNANVTQSNFTRCIANTGGGCIYISGVNALIRNSSFTQNKVTDDGSRGGSILVEGDGAKIINCDFERCTAYDGGVIYVSGSNVQINDSSSDKTGALNHGGAIYVAGSNVVIDNFTSTLTNATANGGAIYVAGDMTQILNSDFRYASSLLGAGIYVSGDGVLIDNSIFKNNNATASYLGTLGGAGGSIYVEGDNTTISNSEFELVHAHNYGGAIYVDGDNTNITTNTFDKCDLSQFNGGAIFVKGLNTTIEKSNFTQNRVNIANWAHGGSIEVDGDNTTIRDSIFKQCSAWDGGAIYVTGDYAIIDNATITQSKSSYDGGAIYVAGDYVTVVNSNISKNNATRFGGAIYVAGDNGNFTNNDFSMCIVEVYHGGAIYVNGLNTTIDRSNFTMCNASGELARGGAIDVEGKGTNITHCLFDMCHATDMGGAIYVYGNEVVIDENSFNRSSANRGGAIYILGHNALISNSNISYSNATVSGGGIFVDGYFSNITNVNLSYCFAVTGHGGAIYVAGASATITNSDFNLTRSFAGNGGAIYITGIHTDIFNSTFDRCGAVNGGVIYVVGFDADISGNFTNSNSVKDGGVLYIVGEDCQVFDSTFKDNVAGDDGGAIYWEGNGGSISNIICINNKGPAVGSASDPKVSSSKGGTICLTGSNVTVSKSVFNQSYAGVDGGAMFITGNNVNVTDSKFNDCHVNDTRLDPNNNHFGGALHIIGNDTHVLNCTFDNCTAPYEGGTIYVVGDDVIIANSTITNSSANDGGAIYVEGDNATISVNISESFAYNKNQDVFNFDYYYKVTIDNALNEIDAMISSLKDISSENITSQNITDLNNTLQAIKNAAKNILTPAGINSTCLNEALSLLNQLNGTVSGINATLSFEEYENYTMKLFNGIENVENDLTGISAVENSREIPDSVLIDIDSMIGYLDSLNSKISAQNITYINNTLHLIRNATEDISDGSKYNSSSINLALRLLDELNGNLTLIKKTAPANVLNPLFNNITSAKNKLNNLSDNIAEYLNVPNSYGSGGAIYVSGNRAIINESTITHTLAYYGGAIYISGHNATIDNSDFNNINATEDGGALYITGHEGKLYNSNFTNNSAGDDGGAIYWQGDRGTIVNIACTNNHGISFNESSSRGGAICLTGSYVTIDKSKFDYNNISYREGSNFNKIDGGALFITGNNVNITDTEFSCNNASHYGGTFYILGNETFVKNCTIDTSYAVNGGAIYIEGHNATISVNVKNSNASAEASNLVGNGGAIYISGNHTNITDSSFDSCYAKNGGNGGAIYIGGVNATVEKSDFHKTGTLEGYGGAIFIDGNHAKILDSKVNDSFVGTVCGWELDGAGSIVNKTSSVARDGGAIYVKSVNATIDNVTILNSNATRHGGAIYVEGSNANISATIVNCTSGVPKSSVAINPTDYSSNVANISANIDVMMAFMKTLGPVSLDTLNELYAYLNNAKAKVSSIFTNKAFNQGNFDYVNTYVKLVNSTLLGIIPDIPVFSDLLANLKVVEDDLKNISDNQNYTQFDKTLKNRITTNLNSMTNFVNYYRNADSSLISLKSSMDNLFNNNDYDHVKSILDNCMYLLNDNNNKFDLKDSITALKKSDSSFDAILPNVNEAISQVALLGNLIQNANDDGIVGDGGAIYVDGVNTNISSSKFENCFAYNGGDGGAIYIGGVNATVEGSDFYNTGTVEGYGGAIYIDGDNATVSDSMFNRSFVGGVAVWDLDASGAIVSFTPSVARDGGAIYVKGDDANIENVTILNSNATRHGGAIYVEGSDANISATIINCTAGVPESDVPNHIQDYASDLDVLSDNVNEMDAFMASLGNVTEANLNSLYNYLKNARDKVSTIFSNGAFNQNNFNTVNTNVANANSTLLSIIPGTPIFNDLIPYLEVVEADLKNISDNPNLNDFNSVLKSRLESNLAAMRDYADYYKQILGWLKSLKNNVEILKVTTDYNTVLKTVEDCQKIVNNNNFKDKLDKLTIYDTTFSAMSNNLEVVRSQVDSLLNTIKSYHSDAIKGNGGGIHVAGDNTQIHDTKVINCLANNTAGGVLLGKNTTVTNSSFVNNTALYGGAMYNGGGGSKVFNTSFINNTATYGDAERHAGGAIYWIGGADDDIIEGCYFENNTAPYAGSLGGALFWNKGGNFGKGVIRNSTFVNNYAARHGGALDWFQSDGGVIDNCTFRDNHVGTADGGAVYCGASNGLGKNFNISNCIFINNTAVQFGGAISSQMTNATIINCTFDGNHASYGASIGIKDTQGKNSRIIGCKIYNGWALRNHANGNGAGGAIYISVDNILVEDCLIINSTAYNPVTNQYNIGGGIYWAGANGIVRNVTIINASGSQGAGIYWNTANGNVSDVHIYDSKASDRGGAVYWNAANGYLYDSEFVNNTAAVDGGGVYWAAAGGHLYGSSFINNTANNGGGLYWQGSSASMYNNTFILNKANLNGGAIYWPSNVNSDIRNVTLKNNTANNGGGIYWTTVGHNLIDSVLMYNKATQGSGLFTTVSMDIINSTLLANRANSDSLTLTVTRSATDQSLEALVTFKGNDNIINAIWNNGKNAVVGFTNVTYLGVNGTISNTGNTRRTPTKLAANVQPSNNDTLYQTQYEDYQNITYYIYDSQNNLLYVGSTLTNISGAARFSYQNTASTDKLHVWAFHPLDDYYTYIEKSDSKKLAYVEIPTTDIYYLDNETFVINVAPVNENDPTPTGNITVWFENQIIYPNIILDGGKSFQINLTGLVVGTYTVNVTYTGDDVYLPRANSTTFKVMKLPSFIIPTVTNYSYGESGKVIIHIPVNEPNNVTININGQDYEVKINETGYGELDIPKLGHGNYTIYAYYPETHNYQKSRNTTVLEIYPVYSVLINKTSNSTDIRAGELINFTIELYNNGSVDSTNLKVFDELPKYFQYVSSGSNSTYVGVNSISQDGRELVTWNIGKFQKDARLKLWVVVRPVSNGTFTNVAQVKAVQGENASNGVDINVSPVADVSITKEINVTTSFVNVTDLIKYTITVTNNGYCNATNVNVTEILTKRIKVIEGGINVTNGNYDVGKGLWVIGNMANGTSETLTIIARVVEMGLISNTVNVYSKELDTNMTNNKASAKNITALPLVDLNITKTVNVAVANVSDLVNFTITITNHGPSNATEIYVFDTWDSVHLKFVSSNATRGSYNGQRNIWRIDYIAINETVELNITARVIKEGLISNDVVVECHENDTNESSDIAHCEFKALPVADISINKTVNVTKANVTDRIVYTIYVHNNGPCDAHGVYVGEILDSHLKIISNYTETGTYSAGTWVIGNLANGSTVNLTIVAEIASAGNIPNVVTAYSFENDTNKSNNYYECKNVTALPIVDLQINKTVNVRVANVTDTIIYTITVRNNGPCDAHGVNVTDLLSDNLRLKDNQTWIGYYNVTTGVWYIGNLHKNETVELIIYAEVISNGTISNSVNITSHENDTDMSNNNYTCQNVTALPIVDLSITKTASAYSINVTDEIIFYITVWNYGPSNATHVNVTEVLDSHLKLIGNVTDAGYYNVTGGYWYIGDLANGTSVTLNITAKVVKSGYFENNVEVSCFENDTWIYNNTDVIGISAWDIFDLQVNKTVNVTVVNMTDRIEYTIIVKNNGPCNATWVSVIEVLDSHLRLVDNITDTGSYNGYAWVIGDLANGSSVNLTIIAEVISVGNIPNSVNVTGAGIDTNKSNNYYECKNVTALPIVDLQVNKTVNVRVANVTDTIIYTISVRNNGPCVAHGVNVTDLLSDNLRLKDNQTWIGYYDVTTGVWYIGNLSINETVQLVIYAEVVSNGTISNSVNITSHENDTNKSNNYYECKNVTALPIVDLSITKTASAYSINVTDEIIFYITVWNYGPSNATHVNVTEILDSHLKLIGNVTDAGYYNVTGGYWYIGDLANGTSVTLNITAKVIKSGYFENNVEVSCFENDTWIYNNTDVIGISAWDIFDLQVNKTVNVTVVNMTDRIEYTIIVKNNGPCNATWVSVIDVLDSNLKLVDNITDTGSYNGYAWVIGDLANGSSVNLTIIAEVISVGNIPNSVNVTGAGIDTNKSNNYYECKNVTALPIVDLQINKTVNVRVANVTDTIIYTISVRNNGPCDAHGVNVTDLLSDNLRLKDNQTWIGYYNVTTGVWYIGNLHKNETVELIIYAEVISNGTISNSVNITSHENDTDMSNNNYTCQNVTALPIVDLSITKTASAYSVNVTGEIVFYITVWNYGPSNATHVNVTEILDSHLKLIGNVTDAGYYNVTGGYWYIGDLANGSSVTLNITAKVIKADYFENRVEVTSFENDTVPYNNHDVIGISAWNIFDLQVNKTVNANVVHMGDRITYTIIVKNNGPCNATWVSVIDVLDSNLKLVDNITDTGSYNGYAWVIGDLANGSSVNLTIIAEVLSNGTIPNEVTLQYAGIDTNKSNDHYECENVTALPIVELQISKTVNVTVVNVTDSIEFTITVQNNGPSLATDVNVTEVLSEHVQLINNETGKGYYDGVIWHIGNLANKETASLTLTVRVIGNGTISNTAHVISHENKSGIIASSQNVTALPIVDLNITKHVNATLVNVSDLIRFTIVVCNEGPSNATCIKVTERLSELLKIVPDGINATVGTYDLTTGLWTIEKLANKSSATLTIVAKVIANGTISNAVSISCHENDTDPSNNNASSQNVTALPVVDLNVTKQVNVTLVNVSDSIEFTIVLRNDGPSTATNVVIRDKLINILNIIKFDITPGKLVDYDLKEGIWLINQINPNETVVLTVIAKVIGDGIISNAVSVTSDQNDTNESNSHASSKNATALAIVDLQVNKTVNSTSVTLGNVVEYIITVVNSGPSNATDVVVADRLDSHFEFVSFDSSRSGITYDAQTGEAFIGNLNVNETVRLTIIARAISLGNIPNAANVTSHENDTNRTNNYCTSDNVTALKLDPIYIDYSDITYGEDEFITVKLPVDATGTVNITVGGRHYDNLEINNGIVKLPVYDLAGGEYDITVFYGGDEKYAPNTTYAKFTVHQIVPVITIEVADIWVGEVEVLNVTVNAPGSVNVTVNGKTVTIPLENGVITTDLLAAVKDSYFGNATWNIWGLPAGPYPALAVYLGNENYTSVSARDLFHVMDKASTVVVTADDINVGEDAIINIQVGPQGVSGNVTVTIDGKSYVVEIDENGWAQLVVSDLKAGLKKVHVVYNGAMIYRSSENSTTFNVFKLKPTVEVFAPEITVGEDGIIIVSVPDDATGTVTIEIAGKRYTAPIEDGEAIFTVPGLSVGVHEIKVYYSGDEKYLAANATGSIKVNSTEDKNETHHPIGLEVHETGNPIFVLLLIFIFIGFAQIRRFGK